MLDDKFLDEQFTTITESITNATSISTDVMQGEGDLLTRQMLLLIGQQNWLMLAIYREVVSQRHRQSAASIQPDA